MPNTSSINPKRGEIWLVDLGVTEGSEIDKKRPAVVVSSDGVGQLPIRLAAPITEWKDKHAQNAWHVKIAPNVLNGLDKPSSIDVLQLRCLAVDRFIHKKGRASSTVMEEVAAAVASIIEYQ